MMTPEILKEFWNNTFARDGQVNDCVLKLDIYDYSTGRSISMDGVIANGTDTLETVFFELKEHLENIPVQEPPPKLAETPVNRPQSSVIHFANIAHGKKTYLVEEHKDGRIIIQTPARTIVDTEGKIGQAILEKYAESKKKQAE
jgi:hypothetical protein